MNRLSGRIRRIGVAYGFICPHQDSVAEVQPLIPDCKARGIFFHRTEVEKDVCLRKGDVVTFDLKTNSHNRTRTVAANLRLVVNQPWDSKEQLIHVLAQTIFGPPKVSAPTTQ